MVAGVAEKSSGAAQGDRNRGTTLTDAARGTHQAEERWEAYNLAGTIRDGGGGRAMGRGTLIGPRSAALSIKEGEKRENKSRR